MIIGKLYKKAEKVLRVSDMPGADDTDATITIRLLTKGERRAAFDESYDEILGDPRIYMHGSRTLNFIFKHCIISWNGFFEDEAKERPFPCTPANIEKLIDLAPELVAFVADGHKQLAMETEKAQEEAIKNL